MQALARILTTLLFDLKVRGLHHIPRHGGVLIVSNHQGNLDPALLAVRLGRPVNYIAKSELFEGWWATLLLHMVNAFPVRQGAGDVGAVKETINRLAAGHVLNIYPEGQRTLDGEIGPLLGGVSLIIRRARVPVVPAVITGSFEAWPVYRRWFRPHPIRVEFGPPLDLVGLDAHQIMRTLQHSLQKMLTSLRDTNAAVTARGRGSMVHQPTRAAADNGEQTHRLIPFQYTQHIPFALSKSSGVD